MSDGLHITQYQYGLIITLTVANIENVTVSLCPLALQFHIWEQKQCTYGVTLRHVSETKFAL
jgi:hypothetical protein